MSHFAPYTIAMKKILSQFALLLLLMHSNIARGQWKQVYYNDAVSFTQIVFPTDSVGYAVASDRSLYKTINGGDTWTEIYFGSIISRLYMRSATVGYAATGGIIFLFGTTDGFKTINTHRLDTCYVVQGLHFIDDSTGYYLNNEGRFRKILKQGALYQYLGDTVDASNLIFATPSVGYLSGGSGVIKTTDGGANWKMMGTTSPLMLGKAAFSSADTGYFFTIEDSTSKNKIVRTTDGAKSFKVIRSFPAQDIAAQKNFCIAVGDTGQVAWSSDAGMSWVNEATGMFTNGADLHQVAITPNGTCFVSSSTGSIYRKKKFASSNILAPQSNQESIHIYPNPAKDFVHVDIPEKLVQETRCEARLYDNLGRLLMTQQLKTNHTLISLDTYPSGLYYISVFAQQQVVATQELSIK